ncbi:MAG: hypothetical protein LBD33_00970, partial [Puniceicoccales bacterium]|nr:hypothetical protein [Puniceicoccales bacterium]
LADEIGLGKTLQVLSTVCSDEHAKRSLVVCPASVIRVWEGEIGKFFAEKTVTILQNLEVPKADFVLASYNQARRLNSALGSENFDYLVLDEDQYILNRCAVNSKFRIAITGTPIENDLNDVWSIFKCLMPGLLPKYKDFQRKIVRPEFRGKLRSRLRRLS